MASSSRIPLFLVFFLACSVHHATAETIPLFSQHWGRSPRKKINKKKKTKKNAHSFVLIGQATAKKRDKTWNLTRACCASQFVSGHLESPLGRSCISNIWRRWYQFTFRDHLKLYPANAQLKTVVVRNQMWLHVPRNKGSISVEVHIAWSRLFAKLGDRWFSFAFQGLHGPQQRHMHVAPQNLSTDPEGTCTKVDQGEATPCLKSFLSYIWFFWKLANEQQNVQSLHTGSTHWTKWN